MVLVVLILGSIGAGGYWYYQKNGAVGWLTETADQGDIRQVISATGSLDAFTLVQVGCQISGIIASIAVDFNDPVHAGQLIAEIDPSTHEAQVQQATANLQNARASERNIAAQLENLKASLLTAQSDETIARANAKKTRVQMGEAQRNAKRMEELFRKKLISTADYESASANFEVMAANVDSAEAQILATKSKQSSVLAQMQASKAQLEGSGFQIQQQEAQLNVAKINLSRTKIFSPIDGVVISRNVDVGQTVAASLQAPTLFTIAQDLKVMQINTSVDEADIGGVKEGQKVSFTVDAHRGRTFSGVVHQVRLSPTVAQNVVNYSVMVNVDNPDLALKPGMTANVEIILEERFNVVRIPTRALFFKSSRLTLPESSGASGRDGKGRRPKDSASGTDPLRTPPPGQKATTDQETEARSNLNLNAPDDAKTASESVQDRAEGRREKREGRGKSDGNWVWTLPANGIPKCLFVRTGLSNNSHVEILKGEITSGTAVIIGESGGKNAQNDKPPALPGMRVVRRAK
jgi:HlyD family secretion protein